MKRWLFALAICAAAFAASLALVLLTDRRLGVPGPYNVMLPPFVVLLLMWAAPRLLGSRTVVAAESRRRVVRPQPADTLILLHTRRPEAGALRNTIRTPTTTRRSGPAHEGVRS